MWIYSTRCVVTVKTMLIPAASLLISGHFACHILSWQPIRVLTELVWAKHRKKKGVCRPCLHYPGSRTVPQLAETHMCDETAQPSPRCNSTVVSDPMGWFHNADTTTKALSMWYSSTTDRSPEFWSSSSTWRCHRGQHTLALVWYRKAHLRVLFLCAPTAQWSETHWYSLFHPWASAWVVLEPLHSSFPQHCML